MSTRAFARLSIVLRAHQQLGRRFAPCKVPSRNITPTMECLESRVALSGSSVGISHAHPLAHGLATRHFDVAALRRPSSSSPPPMDPTVGGAWTAPVKFRPPGAKGSYLAIHMTLLPNGDVLAWPHDYNYFLKQRRAAPYTPNILLWNPATNQYDHMTLPNANIFCSGSAFLPDGRLVVIGGHGPSEYGNVGGPQRYGTNLTEIYDYRSNSWTDGPPMSEGRYYGSAVTLGSGEILAVSGLTAEGTDNGLPEIFNPVTGWRPLSNAPTIGYPDWYPHLYTLSDGRVYATNPGPKTFFIDTHGAGSITPGPTMNYPRRYYGTSAMFAPNQIITIGGNAAKGTAGSGGNRLITNTAEVINLNAPNPHWSYTGAMAFPRFFPTATLLPDGEVLVTGGTSQQDNPSGNARRGAVMAAEVWNPGTGLWTTLASMSVPRLYHSSAVLLADGRVIVGGGGMPEATGEPKNTIHDDMQIYSPPYLFHGPQPVIASAPATAAYSQSINVTSPDAASISRINLVALGTDTHGYNMGQRIVPLSFTTDGMTIQVRMPSNANDAPPGDYMLFLINGQGVPSKAAMIQLQS